ncbi:methionyl-tRNA formyltransferase [Haloechinothrix sp. YIM 98757]|uniref:Methionyl-tRNA formyltransferase n=1 Tax=Haloechinothrix aidingensis TaxID=2752311 RepID=A0A838AA78_9PSEU|nr:methionyl-tRNA formyltransferase [Haloechinothrix aidingensis]MBA0125971.1 methionyl-tRNA formyltransferase [Haloechinothrix aidingensis]
MRLVFAGTPDTAVPSLRALIDSSRHEVVAVTTRPDAPAGRGRHLMRSPVGRVADEYGIEVLTPSWAGDPDYLARLAELAPDVCPVVAYGGLLPRQALDVPAHGWVNLHFSLLPAWRGAAPVQAAIRAGDEITGASTFHVVPELDAGPVYGVVTETVRSDDTAGSLLERLSYSGAELLLSTLDGIAAGTVQAVPQPEDGRSYAEKITAQDARVRFGEPAISVDRHVRAVTPDPGAWAEFRGKRIKLSPVRPLNAGGDEAANAGDLEPGELHVERDRVLVGSATVPLLLGDVQVQGKKRMTAAEWARGSKIERGERLV